MVDEELRKFESQIDPEELARISAAADLIRLGKSPVEEARIKTRQQLDIELRNRKRKNRRPSN